MKEIIKASEIKQIDTTKIRIKASEELSLSYNICLELLHKDIRIGQELARDFDNKLSLFFRLGLITFEIREKLSETLLKDMEKEIERIYKRIGE